MSEPDRAKAEIERVHSRYVQEVVEALGFCPWAREARLGGRVRTTVTFGATQTMDTLMRLLDEVEALPQVEVAFLVFPEVELDRLPFSHFVAEVRAADAARRPIGATVLALAEFHPSAEPDTSTPERLVPFARRSPYPTLQANRRASLDAVRMTDQQGTAFVDVSQLSYEALIVAQQTPPLAARIARNNARTVAERGLADIEAIFRDIARDRDETYAALGMTRPAWCK